VTVLKIKLIKSISGRLKKQIATAHSLGLRKIGDVTEQPDNAATQGKIKVISHLIQVTE
jgi:large subunit ribosomal protein L30